MLVSAPGTLARGVGFRVLFFLAISVVAAVGDRRGLHVQLPIGVHEVAGAVAALVLAFRTNTAYARFWEGRTLWGAIVNASRNVARVVGHFAKYTPQESTDFNRWVAIFAHATRRRLRSQTEHPEIDALLTDDERAAFEEAPHQALYAASQLSRRITALRDSQRLDERAAVLAEERVCLLVDNLGGCERILKTPTPLGYLLLIQRFVAVYLVTLPFALVDRVGLYTPLFVVFVAYPVLMIEALGRELDDPFGHDANDLPLTRICATIHQDLLGVAPPPDLTPIAPNTED